MRYFAQFVIPILLVLAVVYMATRRARMSESGETTDRGTFLTILALGTTAAIVLGYFVYSYATMD